MTLSTDVTKGLKDDLGADLQFNLPSILSMPGFYEARRLDQTAQTPGYSIGYQDNRDYLRSR